MSREQISEQIEAARDLLVRANQIRIPETQIGTLILAIQHLANAVEKLNDRQNLIDYRLVEEC